MELRGSVALVSGGASGLGQATVRMMLEAGGRAIVLDRDEENGSELCRELGAGTQFARADVADPKSVEDAIHRALDSFGRLDIAVNCAGIGGAQRVIGKDGPADFERFQEIVRVNLLGTFNVARLAAWAMSRNQPNADGERGVIVNTASIAAFEGQIGQAAYAASKGGIAGMTLPLARDLASFGIRVVAIAPGLFDTPIFGSMPQETRDSLGSLTPFPRRMGRPDEFASLVGHIIRNTYLNGEVIRLDGAIRLAPKWHS